MKIVNFRNNLYILFSFSIWVPAPAQNHEEVDISTNELNEVAHVDPQPISNVLEDNVDRTMTAMQKTKPAVVANCIKKERHKRKPPPKHTNSNKLIHAYKSQNEFLGLFYCKCEHEFFGLETFQNHLYDYNKDGQFYCDFCDCRFQHISLLIQHLKKNKPIRGSTRLAKKSKRELVIEK